MLPSGNAGRSHDSPSAPIEKGLPPPHNWSRKTTGSVVTEESVTGHDSGSDELFDEEGGGVPNSHDRHSISTTDTMPHSRFMQAFRLLEAHYCGPDSGALSYADIVEVIQIGDFFLLDNLTKFLSNLQRAHTDRSIWRSDFVEPSMTGSLQERLFRSFNCASTLEERAAQDPLRLRMARVLLYLYFVQLCKFVGGSFTRGEQAVGQGKTTTAIDTILEEIYGLGQLEHDDEVYKKRRRSFHKNKRIGKRWVTMINHLGCGVLLLCSDHTSTAM